MGSPPVQPRRLRRTVLAPLACGFVALAGAASLARIEPDPEPESTPGAGRVAQHLAEAARAFLASLPPELRSKASFPLDAPARTTWLFVPGERPGLPMKSMSESSRAAARALIRAALSSRGMLKVEAVMALDGVLRDLERAAGGTGDTREPLAYYLAVYGTPGEGAWSWRIEGHHLSLHVAVGKDGSIVPLPAFLGANPASVRSGPQAGLRVLAEEEDLAREFLASLTPGQKARAVIAAKAPADVLSVPGRDLATVAHEGLAFSELDAAQQRSLRALVEEYASNLRGGLADAEMARIDGAGWDDVRFAWAGGEHPGDGHYYRISGPTFVIEYDNTQNEANHIHTVWHDRTRDFGRDLLREHLEHDHK